MFHDIEIVDFDHDGDVDFVVRDQAAFGRGGDKLVFYEQLSPDNWSSFSIPAPKGEGLKVADLNEDGDFDVIINQVWYQGNGTLRVDGWVEHTYTKSWQWPHAFVNTGDINNDGQVDIVLSPAEKEGQQYRISWFESPNNITTQWTEHIIEDNVEAINHFIGVDDLDNDGDNDVVSSKMHQGEPPHDVSLYLNYGQGSYWKKQSLSENGSHSMRLFDMDNDGDIDLFGANWSGDYQPVELWENLTCPQEGLKNKWVRHVIDLERPFKSIFITSGDIDGDGFKDIVTGAWWYKNPKNPDLIWKRKKVGDGLNNMASLIDFDQDGDLDILGTKGKGSDANAELVWGKNNGRGIFEMFQNIGPAEGDFLQGITTVDKSAIALSWHQADKGIQLVTVPVEGQEELVWPVTKISSISQDEALSAGDLDADGDTDLVLGTKWLENDSGHWREHVLFDSSENPDRNKLIDIDGDGLLDVVIGYEAISKKGWVSWYKAGSDVSQVWQEFRIAEVIGPMSLDVADMDGDGDQDVVVGEHNLNEPEKARLLIYENVNGLATQWKAHIVATGDEHHDGAQVVDIDNDGDTDIVSIGWSHNRVLLYENRPITCTEH